MGTGLRTDESTTKGQGNMTASRPTGPSRYGVLASLVQLEADRFSNADMDNPGDYHIVLGVLRVMHDNPGATGPQLADMIYMEILEGYTTDAFADKPPADA